MNISFLLLLIRAFLKYTYSSFILFLTQFIITSIKFVEFAILRNLLEDFNSKDTTTNLIEHNINLKRCLVFLTTIVYP